MNSRNEEILKFKKAPTPDDVSNFASELDALCPDVSLSYLGKSLRGRSIPILNLGCKNAKTKILYVACHHASEWICASVLLRFCFEISALAAGGRSIYGINAKTLLSSRLICVIPMLNPDGVALQQDGTEEKDPMYDRLLKMNGSADFSKWQANGRGVDLNHNYNAAFEKYKEIERKIGIVGGSRTKYSGEYPESEPEVSMLCNFIRYTEFASAVSFHTQGEVIYNSFGGYKPRRSDSVAATVSKMTGYKVAVPDGTAAYGGMTDWFISEFDRPCFTVECGLGENPLPLRDGFDIYLKLREMLFSFPILF